MELSAQQEREGKKPSSLSLSLSLPGSLFSCKQIAVVAPRSGVCGDARSCL